MKHAHIGLVALAAVLIAGCGGGSSDNGSGDSGTKATPVVLNGVTGFTVSEDGTGETTLTKGDQPGPEGSTLTCTPDEGSTGCRLSVEKNPVLGTLKVTSTGGTVTVTPKKTATDSGDKAPDSTTGSRPSPTTYRVTLPTGHGLTTGQPYRVNRGSSLPLALGNGTTTLTCPSSAGADGCTLTVTSSGATSTGALVRVTRRAAPPQPTNTVTQEDVDDALRRGEQTGRDQGKKDAELEQRAPAWISTLAGTLEEENGVTVEHMRVGGRTVGQTLNLESGKSAPSVPRFTGAGFSFGVKDAGTDEQTLYLYTNIGSPNARPFWKVHGNDADANISMDGDDPNFSGVTLASIATGSRAVPSADTDTDTSGHQYGSLTIDGRLGGTDGTFTCGTCTGTVGGDSDGIDSHVTFSDRSVKFYDASSWNFNVDDDKLTAPHERPQDEAYLYFGLWEQDPNEPDGTPQFKWIHGGGHGGDRWTSEFADLEGTASFVGSAVGRYAIDKTATGGEPDLGTFTATATLTASFDADQLSGTINQFKEGGASLGNWALILKGTGSNTATLSTPAASDTAVVGRIDGVDVTGSWAATVHGVGNQNAPDGMTCGRNGCAADVAGVTGWFQANDGASAGGTEADIVAIGGAFGAAKQ